MTLEKSKTCAKYRQWYGTFIKLVEVYQNSTDQSTVFRFKALYTKAVANKELRVFMNDGNQLTVKTLDWKDSFYTIKTQNESLDLVFTMNSCLFYLKPHCKPFTMWFYLK
jgi:hypothetical protein